MHALVFFLFLALCSLSNVSFAEANQSLSGFSIDLIHRDSPLSPFYNSSMTPSQLMRNAVLRSISRFNRVSLSLNKKDKSPETIIIPGNIDYLMKFYIGTPPVERFAMADTGSDLIWVQCSPCDNTQCFPQDAPFFDPKRSSTFARLSCNSKPCRLLSQLKQNSACGQSGQCLYGYGYGDGSFTKGELGTDSISFGSTGGGRAVVFPKSIFGCGYNNKGISVNGIGPKASGFVGLGAGKLSLVSQLGDKIGHKFSYCLLPSSSTSYSKLKFGSQAVISGNGVVSTPLVIKASTLYVLNLEGISVGQKKVPTGQTGGNIVIDSGTPVTRLERSFYNEFETLVKEAIGAEAVQNPSFNYCFTNGANLKFPDFVFQFTEANVHLKFENLFLSDGNNLVCLAVIPTDGIPIFGNLAQINFQVEYDLKGKKVSFLPADCAKN